MTHRTYAINKVRIPARNVFLQKYHSFDYSVIQDFYNILVGKGGFYTGEDRRKRISAVLEKNNSWVYRTNPSQAIDKQLIYDDSVAAFIKYCVKAGIVRSTSIEDDIRALAEFLKATESSYSKSCNDCNNDFFLPLLTSLERSDEDIIACSEGTNFLQEAVKDDCIDDIRLLAPKICRELLEVQKIAQTVKARLAYNQGTARRDTNAKTDFAQQRSNRSLQEARFMARSEYAYDTNTRLARLVANQAQVLVPQRKARKKFARFLLLDCSSSMTSFQNYSIAAAVLLDSIDSILQHGDTLHLAMFGDDFLYKGEVTKDNAHDILLHTCNEQNYNQCTSYGAVCQTAYSILQDDPTLEKLEIVLLSDGEISRFQPLTQQQECVVHFIDLANTVSQSTRKIHQMVREHNGTITKIKLPKTT